MGYVLVNCNLFDGKADSNIKEHMDIFIENGKIVKIEQTSGEYEGCEVVDMAGKYLMPGLINMHCHLFGSGKPSKKLGGGKSSKRIITLAKTKVGQRILNKVIRKNMLDALYSGCTTVRGVGDFFYSDVRVRDQITDGLADGPRLLVSGPAITVPGGHGDGTFSVTGATKEELVSRTDENDRHKVDLIKICVTGGVMDAKVKGEPGVVRMNLEQTKAVCDRAHALKYQVASHTESSEGVMIALQGGVDTIEHGSSLDEAAIRLFQEKNAALICTLSPALPLAKFSPQDTMMNDLCVYNSEVLLENMIKGVKTALEHNIMVGLGTDASCPFATQYNMWREAAYFVKYIGVSNAYALHTATLKNAQILHIDDQTGSIETGKCADLIAMEKNPLEDMTALSQLSMVIARGKRYEHPSILKNPKVEQMLDTLL